MVINSSQNIDDFFFLTEVFVTSPAKNSYFFVVFKVRNEKCRVWGHERFSNTENDSVTLPLRPGREGRTQTRCAELCAGPAPVLSSLPLNSFAGFILLTFKDICTS